MNIQPCNLLILEKQYTQSKRLKNKTLQLFLCHGGNLLLVVIYLFSTFLFLCHGGNLLLVVIYLFTTFLLPPQNKNVWTQVILEWYLYLNHPNNCFLLG